jgi:hypothetical protein
METDAFGVRPPLILILLKLGGYYYERKIKNFNTCYTQS